MKKINSQFFKSPKKPYKAVHGCQSRTIAVRFWANRKKAVHTAQSRTSGNTAIRGLELPPYPKQNLGEI